MKTYTLVTINFAICRLRKIEILKEMFLQNQNITLIMVSSLLSLYIVPYWLAGLRWVYPYYFTFTSHAKGRWVGSTIYNLFCKEFQAETPEYYVSVCNLDHVHEPFLFSGRPEHWRPGKYLVQYVACTVYMLVV